MHHLQPFTWQAGALFIATGVGLYYYFTTEKAKLLAKKGTSSIPDSNATADCFLTEEELATASYGKAKIGGPFSLVTHEGKPFTQDDLRGHWNLIYFGFTNCPDVCPDELDKMSEVVTAIGTSLYISRRLRWLIYPRTEKVHGPIMQPIFISCDPARDTVEQTAAYVKGV